MAKPGIYERLRRTDKFQLNGGHLLFAPRYPQWLERPGFWDEAHWHDEAMSPLFTFAVLGTDRREIPLNFKKRRWWPGKSVTTYGTGTALKVFETRFIDNDGRATSAVTVKNRGEAALHIDLVFWTRLPHEEDLSLVEEIEGGTKGISLIRRMKGRRGEIAIRWQFSADREADGWTAVNAERFGKNPNWLETPYASGWSGELDNAIVINELRPWGALWPALQYHIEIEPGEMKQINFGVLIAEAKSSKSIELVSPDSAAKTEADWRRFFADVPTFQCSDPLWTGLWDYRWYLLKQNLKIGGFDRQPRNGICEGPEIFHQPISYSTPPIAFDARWHNDSTLAWDTLLNFFDMQEENGRLPGALHHDSFRPEFFYHADWGRAVERTYECHPDKELLKQSYKALSRYGHWLQSERDAGGSGMIDIINHMETGQEFNSRYAPANAEFDDEGWDAPFRLKGVDTTVYAWFLWNSLKRVSKMLSDDEGFKEWSSTEAQTRNALLKQMWDEEAGSFFDVLPERVQRTRIHTLTNLYPFMTPLPRQNHMKAIHDLLLNPDHYWTPVPAATLSQRDPDYDADARWRGKHRVCTWNGRVWPMTQSHIVEALAKSARLDPALNKKAAEFLLATAKLHFPEGDYARASCYEHYHPVDGTPCWYRGIDDYLHCWVIDLIVRYVAGFRPDENGEHLNISPLPLEIGEISLKNLPYGGSMYDIMIEAEKCTVVRDGRQTARGRLPLAVELPE